MGRKALDMAEGVVVQLIAHLGPNKFMVAVMNATAHGGAFHDCAKVDLDFDEDDLKLNAWHEGLDRLQEVGKWLETDSDTENFPAFIQNRGRGETGLSKFDQREVSELRLDDQSVQPISIIESLVFDMCGRKIRIMRKDSKKTSVILRGSLLWFVDALRKELMTEGDVYDVIKFIAVCIGEDKVKVFHEDWEFTCRVDGHIKRRRIHAKEDDSDRFEINIDDLDDLIEERLGARFEIVVEGIVDTAVLDCSRAEFIETLDLYVSRVRSVGYVVDSLFDLYGLTVKAPCVRQRYVGGPGVVPLSQRSARRRLEALN